MMTDVTPLATPDLQAKAVELIDQLTAGLKSVAPQMADVTLHAVRLEAAYEIALNTVWAVGAAYAASLAVKLIRRGLGLTKQDRYEDTSLSSTGFFYVVSGSIGLAVMALIEIASLTTVLSPSYWVAATDPRLALALRVINKLM